MKVAIVVLVILGVLAGLCASILVSTLRARGAEADSSGDTQVLVAAESLPAMTVINSSHVNQDKASRKNLPPLYLSNPVHAIGRVLAVPLVEGQVLTESCFVTQGSGAQLAAAIPEGMRAVSVTPSNSSIMAGLLYPGCIVDVVASFKLPFNERNRGEGVSTTLLTGIQVLAVQGTSVISRDGPSGTEQEKNLLVRDRYTNQRLTVTLMVNPDQAEGLQLAEELGSISLALRNPLDKSPVNADATVLSQGRLARFGSALDPAYLLGQGEAGRFEEQMVGVDDWWETTEDGKLRTLQQPPWPITVIRGNEVKQQDVEVPNGKITAVADAESSVAAEVGQ